MPLIILVLAMVVVGLVIGFAAGRIWRETPPLGSPGDYIVAVVTAIAIGLLDWFVIPAMGFSDSLKYLGVALEPALGALIVLWLIQRAKQA
jgi:uncharacterized membrane protein YeaQ/YmgE (transglycosylase-associated protein family)